MNVHDHCPDDFNRLRYKINVLNGKLPVYQKQVLAVSIRLR